MDGSLSFNTHLLQTDNIITNVINHTDLPEQVIGLLSVANSNRSAITSIDSPSRVVSIAGVIKGDSKVDLDQRIDAFKGYFNGKDKHLDINYAGGTRRYIATKNAIGIERNGALSFAKFSVEFICTEPFGLDITPTVLVNVTGHTTATLTVTPTVAGTAPYQLPVFTITINTLTGAGDYIQLSNNANNQALLVFGKGLADGDVLVVDCAKREVTLNETVIDYDGLFFELEPGVASITYTDGFTTRNVDIYAEYIKRYN